MRLCDADAAGVRSPAKLLPPRLPQPVNLIHGHSSRPLSLKTNRIGMFPSRCGFDPRLRGYDGTDDPAARAPDPAWRVLRRERPGAPCHGAERGPDPE